MTRKSSKIRDSAVFLLQASESLICTTFYFNQLLKNLGLAVSLDVYMTPVSPMTHGLLCEQTSLQNIVYAAIITDLFVMTPSHMA